MHASAIKKQNTLESILSLGGAGAVLLLGQPALWLVAFAGLLGIERPRKRLPDAITTLRGVFLGLLLAISYNTPSHAGILAAATLAFLLLDGLDGFWARKQNIADTQGARLDVRVDAWATWVITSALVLLDAAPMWVCLPGLWRSFILVLPAPEHVHATPLRSRFGRFAYTFFLIVLAFAAFAKTSLYPLGWHPFVDKLPRYALRAATTCVCISLGLELLQRIWLFSKTLRWQPWAVWLGWLSLLNALLFVPAYTLLPSYRGWFPILPRRFIGIDKAPAWEPWAIEPYLRTLFWARNEASLFRFYLEFSILALCVWLWPKRRVLALAILAWLPAFVLCLYEDMFRIFTGSIPSWDQSLSFLSSFGIFVQQTYGMFSAMAAALASASVLALLGALLAWLGWQSCKQAQTLSWKKRALWALPTLLALSTSYGLGRSYSPHQAVVTSLGARIAQHTIPIAHKAPSTAQSNTLFLRAQLSDPKWQFLEPDQAPDLIVVMIESYGRAISRPPHDHFWRPWLRDFGETLAKSGWQAQSFWAQAASCGGKSWIAASNLHLGIPIQDQHTYNVAFRDRARAWMEKHSVLGMLAQNGYATVALHPANTRKRETTWGAHIQIDQKDLNYTGEKMGFGRIPDQYSLFFAEKNYLKDIRQQSPMALFFETVSSHIDYKVPGLLPQQDALQSERYHQDDIELDVGIPKQADKNIYAVAQTMKIIAQYLDCCAKPNTQVVLLGDHQAPLLTRCEDKDWAVPVHFLSKQSSEERVAASEDFIPKPHVAGWDLDPNLEVATPVAGLRPLIFRLLGGTPQAKSQPQTLATPSSH